MRQIILFFLFSFFSFAQLKVEKARFRSFEIEITGPPELKQAILNDLEISGVFKITSGKTNDGSALIESLEKETQITLKQNKNKRVFKYASLPSKNLAHPISNEIYKFFTGETGIFSSHIAASNQNKQIILLDFDGQNPKNITHNGSTNILPILSPDGKEIFFTSYLNKNSDLYSIQVDGKNLKSISKRPGINSGVSFSPDGKHIAFTLSFEGKSDIYLADRQGQNLKRLSSGFSLNTSPSFSPDGSQIAFVSTRSGNPQIYIMSKDGSNIQRMTFQGKYNQAPKWSPLGDYIVFTGRDEYKTFDIFLLEVKTQKISRVTQEQGSNDEASFSPNGRMLVFCSTRKGARDLFVSNLDGTFQKQITESSHYWTPYWGN